MPAREEVKLARVGSTGQDFDSFFVIVDGSRISEFMKERGAVYMRDYINSAVSRIVEEERERCAKIAEADGCGRDGCDVPKHRVADGIAAAIRSAK